MCLLWEIYSLMFMVWIFKWKWAKHSLVFAWQCTLYNQCLSKYVFTDVTIHTNWRWTQLIEFSVHLRRSVCYMEFIVAYLPKYWALIRCKMFTGIKEIFFYRSMMNLLILGDFDGRPSPRNRIGDNFMSLFCETPKVEALTTEMFSCFQVLSVRYHLTVWWFHCRGFWYIVWLTYV